MADRLAPLIEKLEAGEPITQDDVDRLSRLQELDAAQRVSDTLEEMMADEQRADEQLARILNGLG